MMDALSSKCSDLALRFAHCKGNDAQPTGNLKHRSFHKTLKLIYVSECLINTRLGSVPTQSCTASVDGAGFGPD